MTHGTTPRPLRAAAPLDAAPVDLRLLAARAVTELCHSEHTIHCGLTITRSKRVPETVASSSDVPIRLDWLQQELRQGPDLTSVASDLVVSKDLAADARWPDFGRMCTAVFAVRSMVSVHAHAPGLVATLKFFSEEPTALDHLDVDAALRVVRLALPVARRALDELAPAGGEQGERTHCSTTALALGMVTAQFRLGPADGFALLSRTATRLGRSLHEVAADVARRGQLLEPTPPPCPAPGGERPSTRSSPRVATVGGPDLWREPPTSVSSTRPSSRTAPCDGASRTWNRVDAAGVA